MDTLIDYIQSLCVRLRRDARFAAAGSYRTVLRSLTSFRHLSAIRFADVTPAFLKEYEHHLFANDCCRNTVSLYMRLLRSICRQAAAEGYMDYSDELFAQVFTGYDPCHKRAVSADIIIRLLNLDLPGDSGVAFARDLFLLSFYLRGIPFIDLAHLRKSDIRDGVLYYRRSKTGQPLAVTLEVWALDIIDRYKKLFPGSPYLLPIIKSSETDDDYKQYQSALRLYNKRLHQISFLLGLKKKLTSYVARHSWATLAYHEGIPVSEISAGLSHTSEQVTYAYLESFNADTLASVNLQVVALVNSRARKHWEVSRKQKLRKRKRVFRFSKGTGMFTLQRND